MKISSKDGSKVMTVIASPGQGPDRSTEVSYTDTKVRFDVDWSHSTLAKWLFDVNKSLKTLKSFDVNMSLLTLKSLSTSIRDI
jgi:hypothetical protein